MKKTKYLAGFLLFIVSFLFIGELSILSLSNFTSEYYALSFQLREDQSPKGFLSDIGSSAAARGTDVFALNTTVNSMTDVTFRIYGTEGSGELLTQNGIRPGSYHSLLLGRIDIEFSLLDDYVDDPVDDRCFIIGSYEDCLELGKSLSGRYSVDIPYEVKKSYEKQILVCSVWGITFFLLLLISAYDIALIKREGIVRMILGEPLSSFISKNVLQDTAVFGVSFIAALLLTSVFTPAFYFSTITVLFFLLFLLLNSLIYIRMFRIDFRKATGSRQEAKNLIKISYFYKCAAVLLMLLLMGFTAKSINGVIDYIRQGDFFRQHEGYCYLNVYVDPADPRNSDNERFLYELLKYDHVSIVDLQNSYKGSEYVYMDDSSGAYLPESVKGASEEMSDKKVYFLIPETLSGDNNVKERSVEIWSWCYAGRYPYEFVFYDSSRVLAVKNAGKTIDGIYLKNPIIIYNNIGTSSYAVGDFEGLYYIEAGTLFRIDDKLLESYIANNKIYFATDALDNYTFHAESAKRNAFAGAVFISLIFLINIILSRNLIYYEYRIRAVEFFLDRILGNSPLRAYLKILSKSLIPSLIAFVISSVIIVVSKTEGMAYVAAGEMLIVITDLIISRKVVGRFNKFTIARILKGETI